MDVRLLIFIVALCVFVAAMVLFTLAPAIVTYKTVFGRQDKTEGYKYFTPEDFGLTYEKLKVELYGGQLSCHIYSVKPVESCEKVVIFQHGFGAGVSSYMTEIAHFAKKGYAVVATDAYGCNASAGKNTKGFYAGAEALIATYIGVNCDKRLKDKKIIAVGHSWGAYSVLAAGAVIKVDGVIALSAFNSPVQCLCTLLANVGGKLGKLYSHLVRGWFYLFNLFKFGAKGNVKAHKAIEKSGVKTLLIHGEKDAVVPLKFSAAAKAVGANVEKIILPDKKHNPYNTVAAEDKLASLMALNADSAEGKAALASFDWTAATEEDGAVMEKIDSFIESV